MLKRLMVVLVRWGLNLPKSENTRPKDPHRKQMRQLLIPRNQLVLRKEINEVVVRHRPPQLAQRPRTGSKSQANLSILGFALIGLAGIVHRKKGRHEAN